jgi:predicted RNA-binding protein with RPS1 domain
VGEFGEMLVNGSCKNPDGNPIIVDDSEIIDIYEHILKDHCKIGERSDIVIMWALTALSKLSIRIGQSNPMKPENSHARIVERIKANLTAHNNHMNVEIQQRACEFLYILDSKWDEERNSIFEPMPFKGDENMLVDGAKDRAALDDEEGDNQLLFGFEAPNAAKTASDPVVPAEGGLLDLNLLMGDSTPS